MLAAAEARTTADSGNPLDDLVAELADFQRRVSMPGRLSLVGTMLQDSTAPELLAGYRARVVAPRRRRIREILERARGLDLIEADLIAPAIVELGRARRGVVRHRCGLLKRAAALEIGRATAHHARNSSAARA